MRYTEDLLRPQSWTAKSRWWQSVTKYRARAALLLVLGFAFGLRLWGISWGMPYALHADEPKYISRAVAMLATGDLNPHYFENPPLLTYALLAELAVFVPSAQHMGLLPTTENLRSQLFLSPEPFYLLARLNGVVAGTATVFLTYLVARRLLGEATALLSALVLAVAFLHVRNSHYAVNDVPATFLLVVMAYFASRVLADGRLRDYLFGGIFLGLAVATKYNMGIGAAVLITAHLLRINRWQLAQRLPSHLPLVLAGGASLLAFVLGDPFSILDFSAFVKGFIGQYQWTKDILTTYGTSMGMVISRVLWIGFGPFALGLAAVGILLMGLRRLRPALLVASFPAVYVAFFVLGSSVFYNRFAIPLLPFLAILAARSLVEFLDLVGRRSSWATTALATVSLLAALVVPSLVLDVSYDALLTTEDTRMLLGRWVDANVPPGSTMGIEGYTLLDSEGRRLDPEKVRYAIHPFPTLAQHTARNYESAHYDYLIVSSYVYDRYPPAERFAQGLETYREIDSRFRLVASFFPTQDGKSLPFHMGEESTPFLTVLGRDRLGPTIKVYQVKE